MKNLVFAISLILSLNAFTQNSIENTGRFVRVYDLQGKKIAKGIIYSISESSLQLIRNESSFEVPLSEIGSIKTKRSAGHKVLVGATIGATTMAIAGAATSNPESWPNDWTVGEGASAGAFIGGIAGALIGGLTGISHSKNSKSYEINGDKAKWQAFKEMMLNTK